MPIYAYRCETCGHKQDVLQKMSDAPLSACTSCGAATFKKQVTAAGFQLKGSGWYVTDFRDQGKTPAKPGEQAGSGDKGKPDEQGKSDDKAAAPAVAPAVDAGKPVAAPVAASPAPASSTGGGGSAA